MMDGHAGHGHGLARGGIFVEFLDGVGRPSGRSLSGTAGTCRSAFNWEVSTSQSAFPERNDQRAPVDAVGFRADARHMRIVLGTDCSHVDVKLGVQTSPLSPADVSVCAPRVRVGRASRS